MEEVISTALIKDLKPLVGLRLVYDIEVHQSMAFIDRGPALLSLDLIRMSVHQIPQDRSDKAILF
jgi:hypothetical protein